MSTASPWGPTSSQLSEYPQGRQGHAPSAHVPREASGCQSPARKVGRGGLSNDCLFSTYCVSAAVLGAGRTPVLSKSRRFLASWGLRAYGERCGTSNKAALQQGQEVTDAREERGVGYQNLVHKLELNLERCWDSDLRGEKGPFQEGPQVVGSRDEACASHGCAPEAEGFLGLVFPRLG